VVSDESVFPFSMLHSNAGARLRSEIALLPPTLLDSHSVGGSTVDLALLPKSTNLLAEPLDMQDTSDIQDQAGRVVLCPGSTCVLPQDDAHMPSNRDEAVELGSTFGADSSGSPAPASSLAPTLTSIAL
jgi:hypothetical protein